MVEPYHGYKYVKKGQNINTIIPSPILNQSLTNIPNVNPNQSPSTLPTSGLPILIPSGLGTGQPQINQKIFNPDLYKDLLVEKPVIKYLPPEIIPKESFKKSKSKSKYKSRSKAKSKAKSKTKRIRSYDYQKEKVKGAFFDNDAEKQSLIKYKFDPKNPQQEIQQPIRQPIQQIENVKRNPSELAEKKIMLMRPYIIPVENPEKSVKKKSSKKKISVKKIKKDSPQNVINNIDETDESYKIKFDKLKKAYVKKHKTLKYNKLK